MIIFGAIQTNVAVFFYNNVSTKIGDGKIN